MRLFCPIDFRRSVKGLNDRSQRQMGNKVKPVLMDYLSSSTKFPIQFSGGGAAR